MRNLIVLVFVLFGLGLHAQQFNFDVRVNAEQVGATNNQVFRTLETALRDFINRTDWIDRPYEPNERIQGSIFINLTGQNGTQFTGTIQVQSSRPVFNASYLSPLFNVNDKDFTFEYIEFQNLTYNSTSFDSNLVSVLAFYSYIMLGLDADSFKPGEGATYYAMAQQVLNLAQPSGYRGWNQGDGNQSRFFLVSDLLSPTFAPFRTALYEYHFEGLDRMADDLPGGKEAIIRSLDSLSEIYRIRPNAYLTRVFFDAKADEVVSILSGGPRMPVAETIDLLNRLSPINASKWNGIRY